MNQETLPVNHVHHDRERQLLMIDGSDVKIRYQQRGAEPTINLRDFVLAMQELEIQQADEMMAILTYLKHVAEE